MLHETVVLRFASFGGRIYGAAWPALDLVLTRSIDPALELMDWHSLLNEARIDDFALFGGGKRAHRQVR